MTIQSLRTNAQFSGDIWVCIVDGLATTQSDKLESSGVHTMTLADLEIRNQHQMLVAYSTIELCSSLKPYVIEKLLDMGYEQVWFCDSDLYFYNPIDLDDLLVQHSILVTPHITRIQNLKSAWAARRILQTGIVNLGFIALTKKFPNYALSWWKAKMFDQCLNLPEQGIFFDQRWMDLLLSTVPDAYCFRGTQANVAFWNLAERQLQISDKRVMADGQPLQFVHFSGVPIDSSKLTQELFPWVAAENALVFDQLIRDYRSEVIQLGYRESLSNRFVVKFQTFERDEAIRVLYRNADQQTRERIGNPFENEDSLDEWLTETVHHPAFKEPVSRYVVGQWQIWTTTHPEMQWRQFDRKTFLDNVKQVQPNLIG